MPKFHYTWRTLTPDQRAATLLTRLAHRHPWHSPPHQTGFTAHTLHITAACYEHAPHIGLTPDRMDSFTISLLDACRPHVHSLHAWCVLPNHFHLLLTAINVRTLFQELGRLHGRTSHQWNGEESTRGRNVFYRASDRHALRGPLLRHTQLRSPQSRPPSLRVALGPMALVQRRPISRQNRSRRSAAHLATIPHRQLRPRLGRPRPVSS
jgi:REP element-mobilizing transposase RayT